MLGPKDPIGPDDEEQSLKRRHELAMKAAIEADNKRMQMLRESSQKELKYVREKQLASGRMLYMPATKSDASFYKAKFFVVKNIVEMFLNYGVSERFSREHWFALAKDDILYTTRGKPLTIITNTGRAIVKSNTLIDKKTAPKPISLHDKSKGPTSAKMGHIEVDLKGQIPTLVPGKTEKDDVYEMPYPKGSSSKIYLTHEKQDLHFIQMQIQNKPAAYTVIDCSKVGVNPPWFIFKDMENKCFKVELKDFDDKRVMRSTVGKTASFILEAGNRIKESLEQTWKSRVNKNRSKASEKNMFDKFLDANKDLWNENVNKTVKLFNCVQKEGKWEVDTNPDVACDAEGNEIKGDVDLQAAMLADYIPLNALKLMDFDPMLLLEQLADLREDLNSLDKGLTSTDKNLQHLITIIEAASYKLTKYIHAHRNEDGCALLQAMGNINIFNAAMVLGLDSEILHGDESRSPLYPESIILSHTPVGHGSPGFINTYSEFEYYKLLLSNEDILENKIMGINPCWLVEDTNDKWRRMYVDTTRTDFVVQTTDDLGDVHECDNLRDQKYNVFMIKKICELDLLKYKKKYPEKFEEYVAVNMEAYQTMIKREEARQAGMAEADRKPQLLEDMKQGQAVYGEIAKKVRMTMTADIDGRIKAIRAITKDADASLASSSQSSPSTSPKNLRRYSSSTMDETVEIPSINLGTSLESTKEQREAARRNSDDVLKNNIDRLILEEREEQGGYIEPRTLH